MDVYRPVLAKVRKEPITRGNVAKIEHKYSYRSFWLFHGAKLGSGADGKANFIEIRSLMKAAEFRQNIPNTHTTDMKRF